MKQERPNADQQQMDADGARDMRPGSFSGVAVQTCSYRRSIFSLIHMQAASPSACIRVHLLLIRG